MRKKTGFLGRIKIQLDKKLFLFNKLVYLGCGQNPTFKAYQEYKLEYIFRFISSGGLSFFENNELPCGHGYKIDERAVEYPWLMSRIKDDEYLVLDAGSALNFREILTHAKFEGKKVYIDTLYSEGRPELELSPSYIYEDLRDMCFKDNLFDAIYSLSTLEHIGLDNTLYYTADNSYKENDKYSYLKAISEFWRVLKPGGMVYITVPFGAYKNHGWFQIFDRNMVDKMVEQFEPSSFEKTYYRYENDQWCVSTEEGCADGDYFDARSDRRMSDRFVAARCVSCVMMKKAA